MKVILNGMATIEQKTGVGHYIDRLHRETLTALGPDGVRLFPGDAMRPVAARLAPRSRSLAGPAEGAAGWRGTLARAVRRSGRAAAQAYFSAYTTAQSFSLYHEPNYLPFRSSLPTVVTAHDLSVLLHPEWHPAERVARHRTEFGPAVERAAHVITGSNQVRRELLAAIPIPADRVTAVYYGIGEEFRAMAPDAVRPVRERLNLPERFLLYVGAVEPRKNLLVALKAFVDLPAAARARCPLLLAGPWAWKAADVLAYFQNVAAPSGVRHLGYVSDTDRVALYNAASALIYPSRYEGFGLPPVEMLACGGGVIAATAAAVKEVLGRHALFIDPDDVAGWRDAMAGVAADDDRLADSRKGGVAHAKQYTWPRVARETVAVYRRVLGLAPPADESHRAAA
jgi:glycosyltransferase involved in cell wall biosynthesis